MKRRRGKRTAPKVRHVWRLDPRTRVAKDKKKSGRQASRRQARREIDQEL